MQLLKSIGNRILWLLPQSSTLDGYENPQLVEFIFQKSVSKAPAEAPWHDMVGVDTVLDFGGAFGRHYHDAVAASPNIRWAVVETPAMVARARNVATDNLQFFSNIAAAAQWLGHVTVCHSDGAIQYTPDPLLTLRELCSLRAKKMIWNRVFLTSGALKRTEQVSLLSENGPGFAFSRKRVRYIATYIPETSFLAAHSEYRLVERDGCRFLFAR